MGVNVKVQKSPKPKDIVTAEVRLEQDLKSCMRCRYFYGNNRQCIAKKCVNVYFYEVESMEVVGPYDNSVKDQGEEAKLTLITCENKGTMRLIVKCTMSEVLLTHE